MTRLYLCLPILLCISCTRGEFSFDSTEESPSEESNSRAEEKRGSKLPVRLASLVAVSSTNETLGFIISGSVSVLTILNDDGYVYHIAWDGSPIESEVFFVGGGCTGAPHYVAQYGDYSAKTVIFDGLDRALIPSASGPTGLATETFISPGSKLKIDGTCVSTGGSGDFIVLSIVTRASISIPTTISGPISIEEP